MAENTQAVRAGDSFGELAAGQSALPVLSRPSHRQYLGKDELIESSPPPKFRDAIVSLARYGTANVEDGQNQRTIQMKNCPGTSRDESVYKPHRGRHFPALLQLSETDVGPHV